MQHIEQNCCRPFEPNSHGEFCLKDCNNPALKKHVMEGKHDNLAGELAKPVASSDGNISHENVGKNSGMSLATVEIACSWNNKANDADDVDHGDIHATVDSRETGNPTHVNRYSIVSKSEGEENAEEDKGNLARAQVENRSSVGLIIDNIDTEGG